MSGASMRSAVAWLSALESCEGLRTEWLEQYQGVRLPLTFLLVDSSTVESGARRGSPVPRAGPRQTLRPSNTRWRNVLSPGVDVPGQITPLERSGSGDRCTRCLSSLIIRCGACRRAQCLETERLMLESGVFWSGPRHECLLTSRV